MKRFYKNTTHNYLRKAYFSTESFNLYGSGFVREHKLVAFEEKHDNITIYNDGIDKEVLEILVSHGYIRIENVPTFMFLNRWWIKW